MKSTNTDKVAKLVASILFDIGSVIFRPRQPFKYASGILSPVYVDNRLILSYPQARKTIINLLVQKIRAIGIPDVIAGTATAGIPYAALIAADLKLPMVYVRKSVKGHGRDNLVEGLLQRGQQVVVVDDLVTTAGSSINVVKAIRKLGGKVSDEVAIFTYGLKEAGDNLKKHNLKLHPLTDLGHSTTVALEKGFLNKEQTGLILSWAQDPQNWGNYQVSNPTYDIHKSWDYNYDHGPNFPGPYPPYPKEAKWSFLGHKVISPLGIAAGPLPNAKWLILYAKLGYGSIIQKTVRSSAHQSHPAPNILAVDIQDKLSAKINDSLVGSPKIDGPIAKLSITNSFGNPCRSPKEWTVETQKTKKAILAGQLFGVSVYGTQKEGMKLKELAEDYARTALLAKQAGAVFIEANLACPNVSGSEDPFLYKDPISVAAVAKAIKAKIGKTPLVLKVGYFDNYRGLLAVLKEASPHFQAVSAINTIPKKIVNQKDQQALPGRDISGVCGYAIKPFGIKMVKNLLKARNQLKLSFEIIGVGGVMNPQDVVDYLKAGADHVHSATAVMWNPYLAYDLAVFLEARTRKIT